MSKTNELKKKSKTNELKKDKKIPNSLIIYVKTRIPNFYKVNYEPFMTLPKNKSHTVYFDPLIKYYEGPIQNIPSNNTATANKDAIYSQFFEATEFDSMINRILSDFRYMQKPRTLTEAYDEKIIDNNMNLTLKTLFKPNGLFYLNKKPYTIIGSHWNSNDWQIDKKPMDKLLSQFSHLSTKQLEQDVKKEEDDIPEIVKQGNLASSNLSKNEAVSVVASGLQNAVDKKSTTTSIEHHISESDAFIAQDKLPGVSDNMKRLYSEYLRQNIPINYSDVPDLSSDPLTLSLLIDPKELLKFINQNKKSAIIDLYSSFISSKTNLQVADKEYIDACTELALYKSRFDNEIQFIKGTIQKGKDNTKETKDIKDKTIQISKEITQLKMNYMKILFRIADAIMQIYTLQNTYFVSTKLLLEGLKSDYINIIKYYEKPELAIKCIENDIVTLNSLIQLDPEDKYSQSYFTNFTNFKKFYENTLYGNEQKLLMPQINYNDEIKIYQNDPSILWIEKDQYEIYNFKMFLFYSYNQFDIWVLLFKSIQNFTKFVGNEATTMTRNSELSFQRYNSTFPEPEQSDFLKRTQSEGIKASYNDKSKKINWYLVKKDGSKAINKDVNLLDKSKIGINELQENIYISSLKSQVKAYDAIVLYMYLLEIVCLRQNRVYVAEENVSQLNLEFALTLNEYYYTIEQSIKNTNTNTNTNTNANTNSNTNKIYIPESLLWDIDKLHDIDFLNKRKSSNDKFSLVYRGRIKAIQKSRETLVTNCEKISDKINPTISKSGFIDVCDKLLLSDLNHIPEHSFRSSYWLDKTIKNYDIKNTRDFVYNINNVVKDAWYDRIIDNREPEDYLDWMVFDNSETETNQSMYAAIRDALNGHLDLHGLDTTNPYTEMIDGKHRFTVTSLKKIITDQPNNISTTGEIMTILQEVLKIKIIVFEMFPRTNKTIQLGDIVVYQNSKYRVLHMDNNNNNNSYTLYNGYDMLRDIPSNDVSLSETNISTLFRVDCNINDSIELDDYIYLVLSKDSDSNSDLKYRLVKNTANNDYIYNFLTIPNYIKYFIYNNCVRFKSGIIPGFQSFSQNFNEFKTIIDNRLQKDALVNDLKNIEDELKTKTQEYKALKKKQNKTSEDRTNKTLLKGDISDLKARKKQLTDIIKIQPDKKNETNKNENENKFGGKNVLPRQRQRQRPNEEYSNYYRPYPQPQYYNPVGYPMYPNTPSNTVYLPNTYNQRIPYNVSQNKSKDAKSKLSFYITVELELFPGTSANMYQKSVVKCQSAFERIRESYAELFGFQYRPAPMNEVNNTVKSDDKNDVENNNNSDKINKQEKMNKTYKKRGGNNNKNKTCKPCNTCKIRKN